MTWSWPKRWWLRSYPNFRCSYFSQLISLRNGRLLAKNAVHEHYVTADIPPIRYYYALSTFIAHVECVVLQIIQRSTALILLNLIAVFIVENFIKFSQAWVEGRPYASNIWSIYEFWLTILLLILWLRVNFNQIQYPSMTRIVNFALYR